MEEGVQLAPQSAAPPPPPESIIIEPSFLARNWWLLRRAFVAAYEDNCFGIAKGAAYSFLLSLFPILTTLTAILIQANAQPVVHVIATFVQQVLPPGTEDIVLSRLRDRAGRGISLPSWRSAWRFGPARARWLVLWRDFRRLIASPRAGRF